MVRSDVARTHARPSSGNDRGSARRAPTGCRLPPGARRVAAGAALLLALAGSAAAQTIGTIQYRWVEVSVSQFPEDLYLDWSLGVASGRLSTGASGAAFFVPTDTPVGTAAAVVLRTTATLETRCHLEVAMPAPQGCEARWVGGPCTITGGSVREGRCQVAVSYNP